MALDSLDYGETLTAVARLAVPEYADWCFVELLMPDGRIDRVVMEHVDPSKREFIEEYDRRYPLDPDAPMGSPQVIRTGEPELMSDIPDEFWAAVAQDPEQHRLMREVGIVSALVVPMRVRGTVIGDIALAHSVSGRRYTADDLPRAQDLADRCAMAIENARLHTAAERARDDLEAIVEGVADAVTAQSPEGRLVYANDAAVRLLGYPDAEALLSAPPTEFRERFEMLDEEGNDIPLERLPGRRALAGERPPPMTVRYRHYESAEVRWSRVQSTPVFDDDGRVRLAINVIEDITDIKRAEQGHRFLSRASQELASSLDYQETLRAVARLAVPEIADWCAVDVRVGDELERVAVEHVDPERVALAREVQERYPADPSADTGVWGVLRRGLAELYRDIPDELLVQTARDEEHLELIRKVGLRSAMLAPMSAARRGARRDLVRVGRVGPAVRRARPRAGARTWRCAPLPRRERAPVPDRVDDRPHAPDVAAAARAARAPRHGAGGRLPGGRQGLRGRRRLLRRLQHRRRPVVPGDRRRVRQGRRGRSRDRAGALHDPRSGRPPPLAGRDPALAERRDDPAVGRRRALLHDRLRASRPRPLARRA